jgi:hypothetical protein
MIETALLRTPECGCKCTVCHINSEGYCTKTPRKLDLSTLNVSAGQGCESCKIFANLIRSIAPKTDKVYICPRLVRAFGQPIRFTFSVRSDEDFDLSSRPLWLSESYELFSVPGKIGWRNLDSKFESLTKIPRAGECACCYSPIESGVRRYFLGDSFEDRSRLDEGMHLGAQQM